jgi:soluble lytic murein transglycosylase-like protein
MIRARPYAVEATAAPTSQGRGCFSAFILPPLMVLLFGAGMIAFAPDSPPLAVTSAPPADPGTSHLSPIFTPSVQHWGPSILRWAAASALDPNLVAVVMQIESCGDPFARSSAGALGLFQVMPYHFLPADDPYAPDTNALRGMDYLRRSLAAADNDTRLALAGYNGGISLISRTELLWSAETIRYAYWGGGIYQDAVSGAAVSPRLDEWLAAGGAGLCARAGQRLGL